MRRFRLSFILLVAALAIAIVPDLVAAIGVERVQDAGDPVWQQVLSGVLLLVIPWAATYIYEGFQFVFGENGIIKRLPAIVQQVLVFVTVFGINLGLGKLGLPVLPGGIEGVTPALIVSAAQALAAIGIHKKQQA